MNSRPCILVAALAFGFVVLPAQTFQVVDLFYQSFVIDFGAANGLFAATAGLRATPQ